MTTTTMAPKVGDILYDSWGYDQTNIDYYEVVRTSKASVWIRSIAREMTDDGRHVIPISGAFTDLKKGEYIIDDEGARLSYPCDNPHFYGPHECPVILMVDNPPMRKRPRPGYRGDERYTVRTSSFSDAVLWDGVPKYDTMAAGDPGH